MPATTASVERYDALIIGAGQGAKPLALALAEAGRRTALVERAHVGGSCVNFGCTPSKTMAASARVASLARRATDFGVATGPIRVDMLRIRQRKRAMVRRFRNGTRDQLEHAPGLELVFGAARFTGRDQVEVRLNDGGIRRLSARTIVIDTGTRPKMPPLAGLDAVPFLDSTTIMELEEIPERLIVLGGGYVGVEFAQMFRRFGSEVTVVEQDPQLLGQEDRDMAEAMAALLRDEGVEVLLEGAGRRVEPGADGGVRLAVATDGVERTLEGTHLLVAVGRTPNTDDLDLDAAGVETDERGLIRVDDRLRTTARGVYAIGDVKGGPFFTHVSYDDFRVLRANLLEGRKVTARERLVPFVVYTDPEYGRVGLTEREARARGVDHRVVRLPMRAVARALEVDEPRGVMKALVDPATDRILGGAVLGTGGGELISLLQVAMMGGLPAAALREAVFAHPTLAEAYNNLFASRAE